jgi:predicted nucleic acid-binding protein
MRERVTSAIVVDASAFGAVLFREQAGYEIQERWRGRSLIAPTILRYEIANVTLVKLRRHPDRTREFLLAYENFARSGASIVEVSFSDVIALAQRRRLTAYDASYAWLALSRGLDLATLDKKLAAAFEAERAAAQKA